MSKRKEEARTFLISVAAELAGMHAQTLRTYDRLGLVSPQRSSGGGRRYSERDVDLLREVQRLSQDEGVNLAGIKRIIELTNQVDALRARVAELTQQVEQLSAARQRHDVAMASKAVVLWQPRRGSR
ncbi:heat shock protein transcriptional repressor HspR [Mycolicibacterium sp. XJ870]